VIANPWISRVTATSDFYRKSHAERRLEDDVRLYASSREFSILAGSSRPRVAAFTFA